MSQLYKVKDVGETKAVRQMCGKIQIGEFMRKKSSHESRAVLPRYWCYQESAKGSLKLHTLYLQSAYS